MNETYNSNKSKLIYKSHIENNKEIILLLIIIFMSIQYFEFCSNINSLSDGIVSDLFYSITSLHFIHMLGGTLFIL